MSNRHPTQRRSQVLAQACRCEPLEPRRMLAVFTGTAGNDTIGITIQAGGAATIVTINGSNNITADPSITINAGVGNDTFRVSRIRPGTTVLARGDSGNDTLVNPTNLDLDDVYQGELTFEGGAGTDNVIADNSQDNATIPYEMTLTSGSVSKFDFSELIEFNTVESLEYRDNGVSNLIRFANLDFGSSDVALSIHGNGGNDTIYNSSDTASSDGDWAEDVGTGGLFVDGGAGVDTLLLSNRGQGDATYGFDPDSIDVSVGGVNTGVLFYAACEAIDLVASNTLANDVMNVFGKPNGVSLHINSGSGNDTFRVGGGDLDSNGLLVSNTTFLGGPGTDSIITDDAADTNAAGEIEIYSWGAAILQKGTSPGFNFSEFENQTLNVANGSGSTNLPIVNVNLIASTMTSTTVTGGSTRMCRVNIGAGNINNINGTLSLNLSGGPLDQVSINNTIPAADTLYRLTQSQLVAPKVINYSGVTTFTINAGSGNDPFNIDGLAAGTALVVNANDGGDIFNVGGGNVDGNLLGPVTANGGAGANFANINNLQDTTLETQTLNGSTFIDGFSHTFSSLNKLTIQGGSGGTNFLVNAITHQTDILGNTGNDTFDVGGGDIDANIPVSTSTAPALLINGGGGTDSIRFNDLNDTVASNDFYIFQRPNGVDQLRRIDGSDKFVNWLNVEGVTLDANNAGAGSSIIVSSINVNDLATPLRINGNGGSDGIQIVDASAPLTVHTGLGDSDNLSVGDGDATPVTVIIDQSDDVEHLTVHNSGIVRVTAGAVLVKTRLAPSASLSIIGVLDLAGGSFLSTAGGPSLATFRAQLLDGFNSGTWNGTSNTGAINSSLAAASPAGDGIGYGLGSQIAISTIGPFIIAPGDTLLTHALYGDTNLDGTVNLADFNRLAGSFGQSGKNWSEGDSTYDGSVNLADFNALAGNFGQSTGRTVFGAQRILSGQSTDELHERMEELT